MNVVLAENKAPKLDIRALQQVASLGSVHGVLVRDVDQLEVILALGVGNVGQVGVTLLAVFTDSEGIVLVVLLEELLGVVVRVDVNLSECVVDSLLLIARLEGSLEEGKEELKTVARLNLGDELVDVDLLGIDSGQELLDDVLVAVDIDETTDNSRST